MNKKQLLMILGLTALGTAANTNTAYSNSNPKSNFSKEYSLNEIVENSKDDDSTKSSPALEYQKFESLSENKKKEVISGIDKYIEKNMRIARVAKEIDKQIEIPIIKTNALPEGGYMGYNNWAKIIGKGKITPEQIIVSYFSGRPLPQISEAHEKIHAVQNMNNKWYDFENFVYEHAVNKKLDNITATGSLDKKAAKEFSDKFSNGKWTQSEAQSNYIKMIMQVNSNSKKRDFYKEVQTHIFLDWFYDKKTLKPVFESNPTYMDMMKNISDKEFDIAIDANILLLGLSSGRINSGTSILDGVKMLGKYDTDIEGFYQNILKIAKPYGIENVRNAGMMIKQDMINDASNLSRETKSRINNAYKSLKK